MPDDRIPMTREGYDKLRADLDRMQGVQMIEVTTRVATARAMGDLSENAEYHAAREDQGMLQAKINELKDRMSRAYIVDKSILPSDSVAFGSPGPRQGPRISTRKKRSSWSAPATKITTITRFSSPVRSVRV